MSTTPVVFESPAAWVGADLADRPGDWTYQLDDRELDALGRVADAVELRPGVMPDAPLDLSALDGVAEDWLDRTRSGLGFVLVRGLEALGAERAKVAYWLLGLRLGQPVSQNAMGELFSPVADTGADPDDHNTRLYTTSAELSFHTDGADLISLLCERPAPEGGTSRLCSSIHVYNEVVRRRPDLVGLLHELWPHHHHNQAGDDGPQWFPMPIVTIDGAVFRMFLLLWYIRRAAADFPECALTADQLELLDLVEAITEEPGVSLEMEFQPGDMQFLKNSVILHARTAFVDDPALPRVLWRMWISRPDFHDGAAILRMGIPTHDA